eukprot:UN12897
MNLYQQNDYNFDSQLENYKDTIYSKKGIVFPGHGQNIYQTQKMIRTMFICIFVVGVIFFYLTCIMKMLKKMKHCVGKCSRCCQLKWKCTFFGSRVVPFSGSKFAKYL